MDEELYREAVRKIKHDSKCKPACTAYIGPTGPTGPQGPATIDVGLTTTGLPGTQATVTNVGTNQNAILDFVIPAGATGRLFKSSKCNLCKFKSFPYFIKNSQQTQLS